MFEGRLLAIAVCRSAGMPMQSVESIEALAGEGLSGDRYARGEGAFSKAVKDPGREVTLIEREALDAARADYEQDLSHLESRRNLLTEGVPLNHLVGKTFRVGEVLLRGVRLCEPCGYLDNLTGKEGKKSLLHRGGLRAEVVEGGTLRVGDPIGEMQPASPAE
ncbi:MAG: MOSC domain-containing protein [Pirellulaceae bacterium]